MAAVLSKAGVGLLTNKLFAAYFGAPGVALLAHFQSLLALFTQLPNDGVHRGLIRYWAPEQPQNTQMPVQGLDRAQVGSAALWLNALLLGLGLVVLALFGSFFTGYFQASASQWFWPLLVLSLAGLTAHLMGVAMIQSTRQVKAYAWVVIAAAVLALISTLLGLLSKQLGQALTAFGVGQALGLLVSGAWLARKGLLKGLAQRPPKNALKALWPFVFMALGSILFGRALGFAVRHYAIQTYGLQEVGLWQSAVRVSDAYFMVFSGTVGAIFYPQISHKIGQPQALKAYLRSSVLQIVPLVALGLGTVYLLGKPILSTLFNPSFTVAHYLLSYRVVGDFFMLSSTLLAWLLVASGRARLFIALQALSAAVYLLALWVQHGLQVPGVQVFPVAHIGRQAAYFLALLVFTRKYWQA